VRDHRGGARRAGRTALALGLVLSAASVDLTATSGASSAAASAVTRPGFGKAQAQLLMLDPRSAQLSFGVRFGPTVSDHRNAVARAQAQSTDYGLIGSALTGAGCSGTPPPFSAEQLPQPLRADSRVPADAKEATVVEGPITQSVVAEPRPYAHATSRLAEAVLPGILTIEGATDATTSGVDAKGVALVHADVEVARLQLLGGIVDLSGLHWEATNRAGAEAFGAFTIGAASIGGTPLPTQDASATIAAVNAVLSQLGIVILPPVSHLEGDTIFVDPIKIGVAPTATRAREALFKALLDASCDSAAVITVADILLGSVTGGGSLTAAIGGAQAQLIPDDGAAEPSSPTTRTSSPEPEPVGTGAPFAFAPTAPAPTGGTAAAPTSLRPRTTAAHLGHASDGALAVGLGALGLGAVLVEADRRKMRQAGVAALPATPPTEAPPG
jgi:hypothetical protein